MSKSNKIFSHNKTTKFSSKLKSKRSQNADRISKVLLIFEYKLQQILILSSWRFIHDIVISRLEENQSNKPSSKGVRSMCKVIYFRSQRVISPELYVLMWLLLFQTELLFIPHIIIENPIKSSAVWLNHYRKHFSFCIIDVLSE